MAFCISKLKPIPEVAGIREDRKASCEPEHHFGICLSGRNDMEQDKVIQVEAVVGGLKGNVRLIHGRAPFELHDVAGWLEFIKDYLNAISMLIHNGELERAVLIDLIDCATEAPMRLLNDTTRALKLSFPDDECLARYHYAGEEKEAAGGAA